MAKWLDMAAHLKNTGYDVRIKDDFAEGMDRSAYAKYITKGRSYGGRKIE